MAATEPLALPYRMSAFNFILFSIPSPPLPLPSPWLPRPRVASAAPAVKARDVRSQGRVLFTGALAFIQRRAVRVSAPRHRRLFYS